MAKTITVESIEKKTTKDKGIPFYVVTDDEGNEYSCWDVKFAKSLEEGEEAEVRVVQNGKYTNIEDPESPEKSRRSESGSAPTKGGSSDDLMSRQSAWRGACDLFAGTGETAKALKAAQQAYAFMVGKPVKKVAPEEDTDEEPVDDIPF